MEDHHTGQEETLMEVMMGDVAVSHLAKAQPRRRCLHTLAALQALAISFMAALMVYFFIFAPQRNQDTPTSCNTTKVNQEIVLPGSYSQRTFQIFTANASAEYFIHGRLRFSNGPPNSITLSQTSMGQLRPFNYPNIITQRANEKDVSFFLKSKLVKGSIISITFQSSHTNISLQSVKLCEGSHQL